MDAHHPFDSGENKGAPYDRFISELSNVDRELERLDAALTEAGLWSRALLVVSTDHGQAFGQHGIPFHGGPPYEELCRVPLIVYGPAVKPRRSDCDVPLLDLSATVLDLFGVDTPGVFVGRSLVPTLSGGPGVCGRPIMSSTWDVLGLIFPDGYKVIDNRKKHTWEVYDLKADPQELHNVCDTEPAACAHRRGLLKRYLKLQGAIRPPK